MAMFGRGDLVAKPQWLGPGRTSDKTQPLCQGLEPRDRICFDIAGHWNQKVLERWGKTWHSGSPRSLCKQIMGEHNPSLVDEGEQTVAG